MTKAEELAHAAIDMFERQGKVSVLSMRLILHQYGRLIQEAAAKICEETDDAQDDGDDFAERIREMPLP